MNIKITLKKGIQKPSVLTIYRSNGSLTWSKLHKGLETHDLAHYAVEKTLKFKNAFYGIIDKGYTIQDFEAPKAQRKIAVQPEHLHPEALITEHIVNLLEVELLNSGHNENFLKDIRNILSQNALPFPNCLTLDTLTHIRNLYHKFYDKWLVLVEDECLDMTFTFQ